MELKDILLSLSNQSLDASMRPLIEKWDSTPTAIQILSVLDPCVHGALASEFIILTLQILYDEALIREGTTHEQVLVDATWRNDY